MRYQTAGPLCSCGSGQIRSESYDGYGCFLFYYCDACFAGKRAKYRDDIYTQYLTDEPIEPEDC